MIYFQNFRSKIDHVTVNDYFPVNSQDEIYKFLDDSDGLYKARCKGFYEMLFLIRADSMKNFAEGLMTCLFTESYRKTHHWPSIW